MGADEHSLIHNVGICTAWRQQLNRVPTTDIFQDPKKSISMTGNSDVPAVPRTARACNVAHAPVEGDIIGPFKHRHLEMDFGDAQHRHGRCDVFAQAAFVCRDPLLRPEAEINFVPRRSGEANGGLDGLLGLKISEPSQFRARQDRLVDMRHNVNCDQQRSGDQ